MNRRREWAVTFGGAARVMWRLALVVGLAAGMARGVAAPDEPEPPPGQAVPPAYAAGREAAAAKDWTAALRHFSTLTEDPRYRAEAYNQMGFAERNLGHYEAALRHYRKALELDPRHRGAHEYIGETYLFLDDLAKAEAHLAALRRLCPYAACDEYKDLRRHIYEFKRRRGLLP